MPDAIFENPELVALYDFFDGERHDLDHYEAIAREFKAKSIADVGCGTGCLAVRLAKLGLEVTAVDPAQASIDFAREKENARHVEWIVGDATQLPNKKYDLILMTGNVAQVFLTDESWKQTLQAIRERLHDTGHFVFEVRDPEKKAWQDWTRDKTYRQTNAPEVGEVEEWCELTEVSEEFVSFRWTYVFEATKKTIHSDSTLRFRSRKKIETSLTDAGFLITSIRDAPDRPKKEFIFLCKRT